MSDDGADALDALYWRDEILQAMYWLQGEGLTETVEPARLAELLVAAESIIAAELDRLAQDGYLTPVGAGPRACPSFAARDEGFPQAFGGRAGQARPPSGCYPGPAPTAYRLTELGRIEGGRSFRDEFEGLTRQAHGECGSDCWCNDPERQAEPCPSREPQPERAHA